MRNGIRDEWTAASSADAETAARLALGAFDSDDIDRPRTSAMPGRELVVMGALAIVAVAFLLF